MRTLSRTLSAVAMAATVALTMAACVDKTGEPITPGNDDLNGGSGTGGATTVPSVSVTTGKVDVLFVIDNSSSMADKQQLLAQAVPDFLKRLVNPLCVDGDGVPASSQPATGSDACPTGYDRQFVAARDMRVGFVSSSLGSHGADYCSTNSATVVNPNDRARLLTRSLNGGTVPTYDNSGLLVWDANSALSPPGESDLNTFVSQVSALTTGADQKGCGFEAPLEAWYRFLVDPTPPESVELNDPANPFLGAHAVGTDNVVLQQRAAFARPDSLLLVVMLSDEDDCSTIDGVMPPDVCENPEFDGDGKPTGCKSARLGWPADYARGNFQQQTRTADGRITGTPFPANNLGSQQSAIQIAGAPFGCEDNDGAFCLAPGTAACQSNPDSPDCQSCYLGNDFACNASMKQTTAQEPTNLRCWNQKQRFGVDMLYPRVRYTDGLTRSRVYDRDGYLVPNPLFANGRPLGTVVLTGIVGVPWQDIARSLTTPSLGSRPTTGADALDWDRVLGNPLGDGGQPRVDPTDPLMIASNVSDNPAHLRTGTTHPVTGEAINATTWNSVNGHEWFSQGGGDLQYSCIFALPQALDCSNQSGDCNPVSLATTKNPLYETPNSASDLRGSGTYDNPPKQYRAKAYPAPRMLSVIKGLGPAGSLNSICAASTQDLTSSSFGYRPVVSTLVNKVAPQMR